MWSPTLMARGGEKGKEWWYIGVWNPPNSPNHVKFDLHVNISATAGPSVEKYDWLSEVCDDNVAVGDLDLIQRA